MSDPIPIDHVCASPPRQPSWRPRSFDADSPPWGAAPAPESPPWLPLPPPGRSHRTKRARSRPPPSLQLFVKLAGQSSIYSLPAAAARVADLRGAICARDMVAVCHRMAAAPVPPAPPPGGAPSGSA